MSDAKSILNQQMMNLRTSCAQLYLPVLVAFLLAGLAPFGIAWAGGEEQALTTVSVNSRVVPCEPPGVYDGETAYVPTSFASHALGVSVARGPAGGYSLSAYGNLLRIVAGTGLCRINGELVETKPPHERGGDLLVPVQLLARAFNVGAALDVSGDGGPALALTVPGANIGNIRLGQHPQKTRVVLDLDGPTGFIWSVEGDTGVVEVAMPPEPESRPAGLRLLTFDNPTVPRIAQAPTADGFARVVIAYRDTGQPRVFALSDPARIVIDIPVPLPAPVPQPPPPVTAGAGRWQKRNFSTPRGPISVYVLKLNPATDGLMVRPALAGETVHSRSSVLRIARNCGAVAALNGGFFAQQGPPLGLLVIDGQWIKHPIMHRTALGMTSDGKLLMERVSFDGRLYFEDHGYLQLQGINRGQDEQARLVVYTRYWGESLAGDAGCTRLVVTAEGRVAGRETTGQDVVIPADGYVISGYQHYAELLRRVAPGEAAQMRLQTNPAWENVTHALGGGPRLVKDGRPHVTASPERFRSDVALSETSRSAVAITTDGLLMLVAAETPPDESGKGLTLHEFAQVLVKLGARDAMNLDGGGSTTVVQGDRVLNNPRDGTTRAVSNALVVVPDAVGSVGGASLPR